jgi:tRNA dimethylallyltransferase
LNQLIIIAGPTAVGKTPVAIAVAKALNTEIINADSRQVFREMPIGTAAPTPEEQATVKHHFTAHRSMHAPYNASMFEQDVIGLLDNWYINHDKMVMTGGSGLYIDAVCRGIDDLPTVDPVIRQRVHDEYNRLGIEGIKERLKKTDSEYYKKADLNNPQRIMKALEIYDMTGKTYSSFLTSKARERNFTIIKIALDLPRQILHDRINRRVDQMIEKGLLDEVQKLYPHRHLNALNTVGYKELFEFFDGRCTLPEAITKIKDHTRQYARRQLTWFHRDASYHWFSPDSITEILSFLDY